MKKKKNIEENLEEINKTINFYCNGSSAPIFFSNEKTIDRWKKSNDEYNFFLVKDNF